MSLSNINYKDNINEEMLNFIKSIKIEEFDSHKEALKIIEELNKVLLKREVCNTFDEKYAQLGKAILRARKKLIKHGNYKNYLKYLHIVTERDWLLKQNAVDLAEVEEELKSFEKYLDKKYFDIGTVVLLRIYIIFGDADTIEQAVAIYEKHQKELKTE